MEGLKFINWDDPLNVWSLYKVTEICQKVKAYADTHGLEDAVLHSVEDNIWSDPANQRYDIEIRYEKKGHLIEQKLLMLKGEIIDGTEFHKRFDEFYPKTA